MEKEKDLEYNTIWKDRKSIVECSEITNMKVGELLHYTEENGIKVKKEDMELTMI